jgi:hypothetical protein
MPAIPEMLMLSGKRTWGYRHGQQGPGGLWEVRIPLGVRDFPYSEGAPAPADPEVKLIRMLDKIDGRGNPLCVLGKGHADGQQLVLWGLTPSTGGAEFEPPKDNVKVLSTGYEAGKPGCAGAECLVLLVTGPCTIAWRQLKEGGPTRWIAGYDGTAWAVAWQEEV